MWATTTPDEPGRMRRLLITPERGSATLAFFARETPDAAWVSGESYEERRWIGRTNRQAYDPEIVPRHWELSAQMLDMRW